MKIKLQKDGIFLKLMRISLTQLFMAMCFVGLSYANDSFAQEMLEKRITLRAEEKTIKNILTQIETETNLKFVYSPAAINAQRTVSINVQNQSLKDIFDNFFAPLQIKYRVSGKKIVLSSQPPSPTLIENKALNANFSSENNTIDLTVKGVVTDQEGVGLPSVSVGVKGTPRGTTTNDKGEYSITVADAKSVLAFSYTGFQQREIIVGNRTTINVTLVVDIKSLDEVVVVGYGTVKKSDLTGSVSSVKAEQIAAYPAGGLQQALQGRAAGVQIQANNGDPGAGFKIRVRGSSSINASSDPIFVVDGFVGGSIPPPEDIESVEILKDASATAIYGSRGANGVVMVTTKQGKEGKTKIEFNTSYSRQNEINRLDLLNADQYTAYMKEVNPAYVSPGGNTDWQDQIFQNGMIQNHQLSFSGGNQTMQYYVSGSLFDQKGVIINSDFNRYSLTNNLSFKVSNKFKIGLNLFLQRFNRRGVRTQEGQGGTTGAGAVSSAFRFMPNQNIFNPDGSYILALQGDPIDNPFAIITELENESVNDRQQANFSLDYDITKDLKFRTTLGAAIDNNRISSFEPTTLNGGRAVGGQATQDGRKSTNIIRHF
jgi:TonB-dependent starch-binding outer membrane protein SusC